MKWEAAAYKSKSSEFVIVLKEDRWPLKLFAVVSKDGLLLNRDLALVTEPPKSYHSHDFIDNTRFSLEGAMAIVMAYHEKHDEKYR